MAIIDFLKRSGKNKEQSPIIKTINLTDKGLEIDGVLLDLPSHISAAERVFGKPRAIEYKTPPLMKQFLEETYGKDSVSNRTNYAWDELGLYAFTNNGTVINTFGIRLTTSGDTHNHYPTSAFAGTVTVDGKPWLDFTESASDNESYCKVIVGNYSLVFGYEDFWLKKQGGFKSIEIKLE